MLISIWLIGQDTYKYSQAVISQASLGVMIDQVKSREGKGHRRRGILWSKGTPTTPSVESSPGQCAEGILTQNVFHEYNIRIYILGVAVHLIMEDNVAEISLGKSSFQDIFKKSLKKGSIKSGAITMIMISTSLRLTRKTIVELASYQVWATNQP